MRRWLSVCGVVPWGNARWNETIGGGGTWGATHPPGKGDGAALPKGEAAAGAAPKVPNPLGAAAAGAAAKPPNPTLGAAQAQVLCDRPHRDAFCLTDCSYKRDVAAALETPHTCCGPKGRRARGAKHASGGCGLAKRGSGRSLAKRSGLALQHSAWRAGQGMPRSQGVLMQTGIIRSARCGGGRCGCPHLSKHAARRRRCCTKGGRALLLREQAWRGSGLLLLPKGTCKPHLLLLGGGGGGAKACSRARGVVSDRWQCTRGRPGGRRRCEGRHCLSTACEGAHRRQSRSCS